MKMLTGRLWAGAMMLAAAGAAHATTINFDTHLAGTSFGGVPAPGTTVTNDYASQGIVFGRAGLSAGSAVVGGSGDTASPPNGACGLDAAGSIIYACAGDQYFSFVSPSDGVTPATTNSLTFTIGDSGGDLDMWTIHVYDIHNAEIDTRDVASIANIVETFSDPGMNRVWIQWTTGTDAGYLLDDISFNTPTGGSVPEPATLAVFGAVLGFGAFRRARKQKA